MAGEVWKCTCKTKDCDYFDGIIENRELLFLRKTPAKHEPEGVFAGVLDIKFDG